MKYRLTMAAIAALLTATSALALGDAGRTNLIESLVRVESNGRSGLVGDSGKAYGILQVHPEMVREANRISHKAYTHEDMFDARKAREVAYIVLSHYDAHINQVTGHTATAKQLSFIWNGGGASWKRVQSPRNDSKQNNLEKYWSKVSSR